MANQEPEFPWEILYSLNWAPGIKTGNPGFESVCTVFPWTTQYFKTDWNQQSTFESENTFSHGQRCP